jgi:ABC-type polysaccharide/polyol phosphate export permease
MASREILGVLVERQLRLRAKRSLFGVIWPAIAPVLLLMLYVLVFQKVFRVPIRHYPIFLFSGLLPWAFVAQSLGHSVTSLSSEAQLIRRTPFVHALLPIAAVTSFAVYLLITLLGFIIYLLIRGQLVLSVLPILLPAITSLVLFVSGLAMLLSLIDVYNRDLRHILANLLTVWFFLLPITYRPDMGGRTLQLLQSVDPMSLIVGRFREALYYGHVAQPMRLLLMTGICVTWFLVCLVAFRRLSVNLPKDV